MIALDFFVTFSDGELQDRITLVPGSGEIIHKDKIIKYVSDRYIYNSNTINMINMLNESRYYLV